MIDKYPTILGTRYLYKANEEVLEFVEYQDREDKNVSGRRILYWHRNKINKIVVEGYLCCVIYFIW